MGFDDLSLEQQLAAIYVGYFGRGADSGGLDYWIGDYNAYVAGGISSLPSLINIATSFSQDTEAKNEYAFLKYPQLMSDETSVGYFIGSVYQNLFNRNADTGGKAYWTAHLQNTDDAFRVGAFILSVMRGAQNTDEYKDITTLQNKSEVSLYYANKVASENVIWTPADDLADAACFLPGVTDSAATVTVAKAVVDVLCGSDLCFIPSHTVMMDDGSSSENTINDAISPGRILGTGDHPSGPANANESVDLTDVDLSVTGTPVSNGFDFV